MEHQASLDNIKIIVMKQIALFLMALVMVICSSCEKDNQIIQIQTQNFPNQIGDRWIYRLTTDNIDTIKVEIVGQGFLPNGKSAKIWKYTYQYPLHTYIDTLLVSSIANDVRIYGNTCWTCPNSTPFEVLHYSFPLTIGKLWVSNTSYGDTTKVLGQVNVSVPAGAFSDVFELSHFSGGPFNAWTFDTIYFHAQIGLVKQNQNEYNLGPVIGNGTWELISYKVY
jgi:hypothetical protein